MDLAKTEDNIYCSHYTDEETMEDPSYDLNKRQLMFQGTDTTPYIGSHQTVKEYKDPGS